MPTAISSPMTRPLRPAMRPPPPTRSAPSTPNRTAVLRPFCTPCISRERPKRRSAFPRTRKVVIIHHTQCGMDGFDDDAFRAELEAESGEAPPWRVAGFTDLYEDTRRSVQTVRNCGWIPHREDVRGFVFDVATATITEVS